MTTAAVESSFSLITRRLANTLACKHDIEGVAVMAIPLGHVCDAHTLRRGDGSHALHRPRDTGSRQAWPAPACVPLKGRISFSRVASGRAAQIAEFLQESDFTPASENAGKYILIQYFTELTCPHSVAL